MQDYNEELIIRSNARGELINHWLFNRLVPYLSARRDSFASTTSNPFSLPQLFLTKLIKD
jgi:hypothetical protein